MNIDKSDIIRIRTKYPDRIPIYITKSIYTDKSLPDIDRHKFLAPYDTTVSQFLYIIRRRIKLAPEQTLFVYVNSVIANTGLTLGEMYHRYKTDEGLLRLIYAAENTFG